MTTSVKEAAAGVWRAFASRDPETIRAVLTEDARWISPADNATQVALGPLSPIGDVDPDLFSQSP